MGVVQNVVTLVVHRDATFRQRAAEALAQEGFLCETVSRWPESVSAMSASAVIAVVLQIPSQPQAALTAVAAVRERLPGRPLVALAASGAPSITQAALSAGAWICLEEPVDAGALAACVAEAVRAGDYEDQDCDLPVNRPSLTPVGLGEGLFPAPRRAWGSGRSKGESISQWARRLRRHLSSAHRESTQALVAAVEAKDPHTRSHSLAVAACAEAIGRRMHLPQRMVQTIQAAAMLHDVGKIGVPDAILVKAGPLTPDEFAVMKQHPQTALDILGPVSFLRDERPLILHHHERYDGAGYPAGLAGEQIPVGARILAVADAVDTMLSPRIYKPPYTVCQVRRELQTHAGRQFDPAIVDVALRWLDETPTRSPASHRPTSITETAGLEHR